MRKQRDGWKPLLLVLLAFLLQGCFGIGDPGMSNVGMGSNGNQVSVLQNAFKGKIYATIGHNLEVISGNGTSRQLVGGGNVYNPALSPDGSKIAFVQKYKNYSDLSYVAASGGNVHVLISGNGHYYKDDRDPTIIHNDFYWYMQPTWSPDGSQLLFLSDLQKNYFWASLGTPFNQAAFEDLQIFSIPFADPTATPQVVAYASFGDGGDRDADYVPQTNPLSIVYTHYTYDSTGTQQLIQIFIEDSTAIANNPGVYTPTRDPGVALTPTNVECLQSMVSPDGKAVVYVQRATTQMTLSIMPLATGVTADPNNADTIQKALEPYKSTSHLKSDLYIAQPSWSPDGKQIAYVTEYQNALALFIANVNHNAKTGAYTLQGAPAQAITGGIDGDSRVIWTD